MKKKLLATLLTSVVCGVCWSQTFPSKPLKLVVPYAAGGVGDVTARLVAQKMSEDLGQAVVIENKPGAGLHPAWNM